MMKSIVRSICLFTALSLSFTPLITIFLPPLKASAVTASDWNPARIIDDSIFFNPNSINTQEIQNFLNAKLSSCDVNGVQSHTYKYNSLTGRVDFYGNDSEPADPSVTTSRATYGQRYDNWRTAQGKYTKGATAPYTCLKDFTQNIPGIGPDAYCPGSVGAGVKSAATIIKEVAVACNINPQVILITLQKEQSLITDDWPWLLQYTKATGMGCPDSPLEADVDANQNGCYDQFEGFFKQIYYGARQFQKYVKDPGDFNYAIGRNSFISYQENNPSCGGTNIIPQTQATAALYNYTPYQPNAAALNNLYGTGDDCSAYGNRNFWRMFNDWFGKSVYITNIKWEPAIISQSSGKINAFARGYDSRLWQTWFDNTGWQSKWNYIDVPNTISSAPSGISFGEGHMDVFETRNGSLWHSWHKNDANTWRPWSTLGAPDGISLAGPVAAVSQVPGKINVFARGSDGRLWQNWFDNTGWQSKWNYIDGPSTSSSSPTAISFGEGHMDVFETRNGSLWHSWHKNDANTWRPWSTLGAPDGISLAGPVAAVSQVPGKINVFARGSDGRLWQNWFDNTGWQSKWNYIDGPSTSSSSPTAISFGEGHMDVFETRNGSLWHSWYSSNGGWRSWQPVGRP